MLEKMRNKENRQEKIYLPRKGESQRLTLEDNAKEIDVAIV